MTARVYVEAPDGSSIEGRTAARILDEPFTVETDDGELVRVSSPWCCYVEIIGDHETAAPPDQAEGGEW